MEFFDWINIPQFFMEYFLRANTAEEYINMQRMGLLISIAVAGGLYLICLIFGGIGLFTIAKREGYKHPWLGFLPFLNTWYAGKIAGEANFFGQKMKRAGLYATIAEVLYVALETFLVVISFLLARPEFYQVTVDGNYATIEFMPSRLPNSLAWAADASLYCEIVAYLLWFVVLVFFCVMYTAFYRKYYARSPFLMVFLSVILPARGFTIFAVRNNHAVDYNEYMRRRMEEYARRNNPYGNGPYNGPYNNGPYNGPYNNGPYNNGPYNNGPDQGGNGGAGGEPFSDFSSPSGGNSGNGGNNSGSNAPNAPTPPDDDPFSDF